jgi:hypothetical protein
MDAETEESRTPHSSKGPSLITVGRQLPTLAQSPIGKAAIWAVIVAFVSVVIGGWSFGHHLQALGLVFAVLAGLSLVALFCIGLVAAVMFASRRGTSGPSRHRH